MSSHPDDDRPPLGFLIVRIAETVDRAFSAALADLALKPRELRLLVLVDRTPGLNQRELARQLAIDAGNLIAVLDQLEERGLLVRTRGTTDRRQREVTLTRAGQDTLAAAIRATTAVEETTFGALPDAQRARLYEMALRVYRSAES